MVEIQLERDYTCQMFTQYCEIFRQPNVIKKADFPPTSRKWELRDILLAWKCKYNLENNLTRIKINIVIYKTMSFIKCNSVVLPGKLHLRQRWDSNPRGTEIEPLPIRGGS